MLYGEKIKHEREIQGLSRGELASRSDITQFYLYRIETGKSQPSIDVLIRIY